MKVSVGQLPSCTITHPDIYPPLLTYYIQKEDIYQPENVLDKTVLKCYTSDL